MIHDNESVQKIKGIKQTKVNDNMKILTVKEIYDLLEQLRTLFDMLRVIA